MSFESFGLHQHLLSALNNKGYTEPTPVQTQTIPLISAGNDVMAGAQTGTGKTAAFALPILNTLLSENLSSESPVALVLVPTRELAQQVTRSFESYSAHTELKTLAVYGGVSINGQISGLRLGVEILVATPGRLMDHLERGTVSLDKLRYLVLDEADRMLDMGFIDDIHKIIKSVPEQRQTLLFSATFSDEIFNLSQRLLKDPQRVDVSEPNSAAVDVEQIAYEVDKNKKREVTAFLIGSKNWQQVLIFTRTKQGADTLAKELNKDGLKTKAIHGDKSQGARDTALEEFKNGSIRVLVATDVASRGLDIKQLKYVINYELPHNAEDYIHRIGRTGRAGESGLAVTLLSTDEKWLLDEVHKILDTRLLQQWLPGFEPDPEADFSAPKNKPKRGGKRRRR